MILSLIRRKGALPRAALAAATGVSAQAITNLTKKLINLGYLEEEAVVRGKVGQPSTPLALAAGGAYFLGLKVGRKLVELALVDFAGQIKLHRQELLSDLTPDRVINFANQAIPTILASLPESAAGRIIGLGIATPFRLWDWGANMAGWRDIDLRQELAVWPFPIFVENDATTACGAELIFGKQDLPADFMHVYIAYFPGGGIVLDRNLRFGPHRNAGALGSMLLPDGRQLFDHASIATLERRLGKAIPPDDAGWDVPPEIEQDWAEQAGKALAFVSLSAVSLADLSLIVIDGAVPPATRARIADATRNWLQTFPAEGIERPGVVEGTLGRSARILGAAALPLAHFFQPEGQHG